MHPRTYPHITPPASDVCGIAWASAAGCLRPPQAVICFSPRVPGTLLTPVAKALRFVPLSSDVAAHPDAVRVDWFNAHFTLKAHGRALWGGLPTPEAEAAAPWEEEEVLVLILDHPGGVLVRDLPRISPELIWAARVPVGAAAEVDG